MDLSDTMIQKSQKTDFIQVINFFYFLAKLNHLINNQSQNLFI